MKKTLMYRRRQKKLDERGFASIVIALILIIVMALFTVGFAQLARREQRSALNKQLSSQAYYAAETGINDAVKNLTTIAAAGNHPDTCQNSGTPTTIGPSENGVQYTCVLVNLLPPSIAYSNIQPEQQRYITSSTTVPAGSLTLSWGSTDGHTSFPASTATGLTPVSDWNGARRPAVIQFSLTPLKNSSIVNPLSRDDLANDTYTMYAYPVNHGGGTTNYTTGGNGDLVAADCNAATPGFPCKVTINNIPAGVGTGPYLFRVIVHYDPSNVQITGTTNPSGFGTPVGFDGQTLVDSTGKAHEVLKRLQVRVPKYASYDTPNDAVDGGSLCKHFETNHVQGTRVVSLSQDGTGACNLN